MENTRRTRGKESETGGEAYASEGNVLFSPPTGPPGFLGYPSLAHGRAPACILRHHPPCVSVHTRAHALIGDVRACTDACNTRLKRSGSLSVHRCTYHIQAIEGESHLLALLCGTTLPTTFAPFDFLTRGKLVDRF